MPTLVTFLVSGSCCGTLYTCVAHWQNDFTATVAQTRKMMQNSNNYLKDGHLMPPERP